VPSLSGAGPLDMSRYDDGSLLLATMIRHMIVAVKHTLSRGESMESQTLRIEEAAKVLGIGRTAAYAAAKRGDIPVLRIGGLRLVPKPALEKMLAEAGREKEAA